MDFCITDKAYLMVSGKAMSLIKQFQIDNCDVTEIEVI